MSKIHENLTEMNCSGVTEIDLNCSDFIFENLTEGLQTIGDKFSVKNILLAILVGVIGIVTIFGNLLVILSFIIERHLVQPFNLFILNLAMTDFLVGITVLGLFCIDTLLGYWPFGIYMCGIWIYVDFVMTFASVFTLVAISVDRLWCVTWPFHFKMHNNLRKSAVIIVIIWFCAIAIWTPPFIVDRLHHNNSETCRWLPSDNSQFVVLYVAVAGHYVPCTIMISCYIKVLLVMRRQRQPAKCTTTEVAASAVKASQSSNKPDGDHDEYCNRIQAICKAALKYDTKSPPLSESQQPQEGTNTNIGIVRVECKKGNKQQSTQNNDSFFTSQRSAHQLQREKRMFVTLTYILFTYIACWFPYYISFHLSAVKPDIVPYGLYSFFGWFTYVNSTLNPFIYAYTNQEFRQAFISIQKLICRFCPLCKK